MTRLRAYLRAFALSRSLHESPQFDRPLNSVANVYLHAAGVVERAHIRNEIRQLLAMRGRVVGDDAAAGADFRPEQVEIGSRGWFVGIDEADVDGPVHTGQDLLSFAEI